VQLPFPYDSSSDPISARNVRPISRTLLHLSTESRVPRPPHASPSAAGLLDPGGARRAGSDSDSGDGGGAAQRGGGRARMKRSEQSYFDSYGKIGIHHEMLSDRVIVFLLFLFRYSFVIVFIIAILLPRSGKSGIHHERLTFFLRCRRRRLPAGADGGVS
jgi:hypothetical protein